MDATSTVRGEISRLQPGTTLVEVVAFATIETPERLASRLPELARILELDEPTTTLVLAQLPGVARTDLSPERAARMARGLQAFGWVVRVHGVTAAAATASGMRSAPRARTLGCEIDGHVHDLLLVGDALYVARLGRATRPSVDKDGILRLVHFAAVLYSRIGLRGLPSGLPDSSPDDAGAAIVKARLRLAETAESGILALDPANLRTDAPALKARRVSDDLVEIFGVFTSAADAGGRKRALAVRLAGDPAASFERLLGLAGVELLG